MVQMSFESLEYLNRPKEERSYILQEIKTKRVEVCEKCPDLVASRQLYEYKKPTFGYGNPNSAIMFIGEAPGKWGAGITGIPFTKDISGEFFQSMLKEVLGYTKEDVWVTNIVKCCPRDNRTPTDLERKNCFPFLLAELRLIQPFVIVTLGMSAAKVFWPNLEEFFKIHKGEYTTGAYDSDITTIMGADSTKVLNHKAYIFPIWHPAFVVRDLQHLKERYVREFKMIEKLTTSAFAQWGHK